MTPRVARGSRDAAGTWRPDDPAEYPPMDIHGTLPWSVLRQDAATWQTRKRWWVQTHGLGRPAGRETAAGMMTTGRHGVLTGGVSVFDPHLAEVLIEWFSPPEGHVLDPCGGGPERATVATVLGRTYHGIDPAGRPTPGTPGTWTTGYAQHADIGTEACDFVLACPPYHDRERYSNDPRDLSAMTWDEYVTTLRGIVYDTVQAMRPDRFAAWVISDVRDPRGHLRGLPAILASALTAAGLHLTNELILISPAGTAHKRMRRPWETCRTTTRTHQVVLVAVKGNRRAATRAVKGDTTCP